MVLPSSNSFRPFSLRSPPRTALNEGTVVVYFGREKTLNDVELYKFNFYQSKFDRLVEDQKAKEAIEVMIASESEIQMSVGQAISLLSSLAAQIFGGILRAKSESSVEPMVKSAAAMLRGHTLWHLTPSRTMKVDVERQIAKAERTLREKWQNVSATLPPPQCIKTIPSKGPLGKFCSQKLNLFEAAQPPPSISNYRLHTLNHKSCLKL
jgi:hypothetical protein